MNSVPHYPDKQAIKALDHSHAPPMTLPARPILPSSRGERRFPPAQSHQLTGGVAVLTILNPNPPAPPIAPLSLYPGSIAPLVLLLDPDPCDIVPHGPVGESGGKSWVGDAKVALWPSAVMAAGIGLVTGFVVKDVEVVKFVCSDDATCGGLLVLPGGGDGLVPLELGTIA